jgi:ribonuclease D
MKADFELITSPNSWADCLRKLRQEPALAVDLEANSMFAYRERVCLIQVSTPTQDYILDPLADLDLDGLGQILADPAVEKIFHAAEYDLILMTRQYGWVVNGLFDTMWAARILGYHRYGLASLLGELFGVKLNKRYQKSNWCQRPLSPEQLAYACFDTHYLFDLRDRLSAELEKKDCLLEAAEIFAEQTSVTVPDNGFDPEDFWTMNGVYDLSRYEQTILKAVAIYRDKVARQRDQPLFKIFSDRTLLEIAQSAPRNYDELAAVHGMSRKQIKRFGQQLLHIVKNAQIEKPPAYPPRRKRKPDAVISRYDRLHTWRKLRARKRGVESDVIVSRDALWELAYANPANREELKRIEHIGEWRRETYGDEILQVLHDA